MTHGSIIGYDINAKMCQISYYNEKTQEPETVDTGIEKENNQIPLVMNYYKETWTYGRQARRMSTVRDSICVEGIWECALGNRKIEVDGQEYEGVQLLADFVKYTLNGFEEIESITFTVPEKNEDIPRPAEGNRTETRSGKGKYLCSGLQGKLLSLYV